MRRAGPLIATALAAGLGLGAVVPAAARDAREAAIPSPLPAIPLPPIPPPAIDPVPPPYQGKLDHLAELMGTLAYLRDLCGAGDGAAWRERMDALLNAEGGTAARRDRLAGSYNQGYAGYQLSYHTCTPAAQTVIERALSDGARLASDVAAGFNVP